MTHAAAGVHGRIVPAKWAQVFWHDAVGCSVMTCQWNDIVDAGGVPAGDYPVSDINQIHTVVTVAGQKRLPVLNPTADYNPSFKAITFRWNDPENEERVHVDLKVAGDPWQNNYRVVTGDTSYLWLPDVPGSQTCQCRVHAETYNQVAVAGAVATITTPPNPPWNLAASVGRLPTGPAGAISNPSSDTSFIVQAATNIPPPPPVYTTTVSLAWNTPQVQAVPPDHYLVDAWRVGQYDTSYAWPCPYGCPQKVIEEYQSLANFITLCMGLPNQDYEFTVYAVGRDGQISNGCAPVRVKTGCFETVACGGRDCVDWGAPEITGINTPGAFALSQNVPNPFNAATRIDFDLPTAGHVALRVYDILGRSVATPIDADLPAGVHHIQWDARDEGGRALASGVYFYRLITAGHTAGRTMVLLK